MCLGMCWCREWEVRERSDGGQVVDIVMHLLDERVRER